MEYLIAGIVVIMGIIGYMIYKDGKNQEARDAAAKDARINQAVERGRKMAETVVDRPIAVPQSYAKPKQKPKETTRTTHPLSGGTSSYKAYSRVEDDSTDDIVALATTAIILNEVLDNSPSYSYDEPTSTRYESCSTSSYSSYSSDSYSSSSSDSYSSSSDSCSSSSDSSGW